MLAILIAWIIISFILLSFGNIFVSLYNTLFKRQEIYNPADTFMIGIIFTVIPLSLTSFFLPSNHYMMTAYIVISISYWVFNKRKLSIQVKKIRNSFSKFSRNQKAMLILLILSFLFYIAWREIYFDSMYYHYQNIRWNEEYPVTPGIGNLKDHLAFNSNYFLISAIFTFRFLFHEPLYLFQDVLFTFVIGWVSIEVINSEFRLNRIVLLILLFFFFFLNDIGLVDSSTDAVPNICIFYYISRFTLYPKALTKKLLLAILLPVMLITFKLSVFPFCLISLYLFIFLIKRKKYSLILFYALTSFLILALWMARNVIVSGYLVYPVYQIDLFNFDWKIPKAIAEWQCFFISSWARETFVGFCMFKYFIHYGDITDTMLFIQAVTIDIFYLFILLSPIAVILNRKKKIKIEKNIYILYYSTLCCLIYWLLLAPDYRFALGFITGIVFLIFCMTLSIKSKEPVHVPKIGSKVFSFISILICCMSIHRAILFTYKTLTFVPFSDQRPPLYNVLFEPYSSKYYQIKAMNISTEFSEYKTNGVCVYISKDAASRSFDKLPCMNEFIYPNRPRKTGILEARGPSIRDGFRVREEGGKMSTPNYKNAK